MLFIARRYNNLKSISSRKSLTKAVIAQSSQTIVALTTDKIPGVARFVVAKSRDIDVLVVEASLDNEAVAALAAQDVRVISA